MSGVSGEPAARAGMDITEAVAAIHGARGDRVVIPTMSAVAPWRALAPHPLDLIYLPSSMGQATALGLGVALARPERGVVVLSGDGSLLMNLGSLVSIARAAPSNLTVVLLDNGVYQVTGGQPTPATSGTDWLALARGAGLRSVHGFAQVEELRQGIGAVLAEPGPTFLALRVAVDPHAPPARPPTPAAPRRAAAFRAALTKRS